MDPRTPLVELNNDQINRYSRHIAIPGFDEAAQLKLLNGSVLVVGTGGLGSPVCMYLAAAGIGRLGIAEFDVVESHNLQRQVLFADNQIGCKKAREAKQRLQSLNSDLEVVLHESGIQAENAEEIVSQYDVVVDGTDNFPTRYLLNDVTFLLGKPLVTGSVYQAEGQLTVLNTSKDAPCLRCLFPKPPEANLVPNCGESGVFGAVCGTIGSLMSMEVVKLLTGLGEVLSGQLLKVDVFTHQFIKIRFDKNKECSLCGIGATIAEIDPARYPINMGNCGSSRSESLNAIEVPIEVSVGEAQKLLTSSSGTEVLLLDIREPQETAYCVIPESRVIPMGEIPQQMSSLPKDQTIVVYCHHGMRSLQVVKYLRQAGYDRVTSMKGGIDQWSMEIDPDIKRY